MSKWIKKDYETALKNQHAMNTLCNGIEDKRCSICNNKADYWIVSRDYSRNTRS